MHARAVFYICDGRQLLDEMNAVLSVLIFILCYIVTKKGKRVNFTQYFFTSKDWGVNFCLSMSAWGDVAA